jgi:uncharacterized protein YjbI with pentapeptide repeats
MTPPQKYDWEGCTAEGCSGVRISGSGRCLAHADGQDRELALTKVREGLALDARGVVVSSELLERIIAAAACDARGSPRLKNVRFERATFDAAVRFDGVTFDGETRFTEATFNQRAGFGGAVLNDRAGFGGAIFRSGAAFDGVIFRGGAAFSGVTFEGGAGFSGATFRGMAAFGETTFKGGTWFDSVRFVQQAKFHGTTFKGEAGFHRAIFERGAGFDRATFLREAKFGQTTFKERAGFSGITFEKRAGFSGAVFKKRAWFSGTTFKEQASFDEATFAGEVWFERTAFESLASFNQAAFEEQADFGEATFGGETRFRLAAFSERAGFDRVVFEAAREFGPVLARRELSLEAAIFRQRVQIEAAAATLCARQVRFAGGVQLRLRWAEVVLDDADLAAPSILMGVPTLAAPEKDRFAKERSVSEARAGDDRPRLLSLRRADVAGLTISNVDLRACRFLDAHNLDRLRIEGQSSFASTPLRWRWTTRKTIAEEHYWRATRAIVSASPTTAGLPISDGHQWYAVEHRPPEWLDVEEVTPGQVATLYRALRKGHEDNKDEPGAADFYYGEMEMRRHAQHRWAKDARQRGDWGTWVTARAEHAILWLYWLVSGYALRAWRALVALAVLLVLFAALCTHGGGFARPGTMTNQPSGGTAPASSALAGTATAADTSFGAAIVYGTRTVIGLAREPQPRLTRWGDTLQISLRVPAPVLLGLAILSVRGRVKR